MINLILRPNHDARWPLVNLEAPARNYTNKAEAMCPRDGFVVIRNSEVSPDEKDGEVDNHDDEEEGKRVLESEN